MLHEEEDGKVALLSAQERAEYQEVVRSNFLALDGACVMDGLKVQIQKSGDEYTQIAYYNGWLHDHYVGCVFVFAPSGVIVACALNAPSSWHDSYIAENGKLYEKLKSVFDTTGGTAVVDLAFLKKRCPFMIELGKEKVGTEG